MKLDDLPFHIGTTETPDNPHELPNTWPFSLHFDKDRCLVTQQMTPELLKILDQAYRAGVLIGTPLADDSYGKPYADDFLRFIGALGIPRGANALEIGAGIGYLTSRLKATGLQIVGIEPGLGYSAHREKYGVEIVQDFFPSPIVKGKFDLICSYAVLEHISDPITFLKDVRDQLKPKGVAIFAVPDCTEEILAGDPTILFHEHVSYFDAGSLARLIESAGMYAVVKASGFGRSLYAIASLQKRAEMQNECGLEAEIIASYPERCGYFVARLRGKISDMAATGSVGVYCGARGLALLDRGHDFRFFDDDPALYGRYLPPFNVAIETRDDLLAKPVDHLVIMSRTFGRRILGSLRQQGYRNSVTTLDQL